MVLELAERALGGGDLIAEQSCASMIVLEVFMALVLADGDELLEPALEQAIADARERGWPIGFAFRLDDQGLDAPATRRDRGGARRTPARPTRSAELHGATPLDPFISAFLVWTLVELGREDEADRLLEERCPPDVPDAAVFQLLMLARGERRIARGDRDGGVADVLLVGERELRFGGTTPAAMAWRSTAAISLAAAGEEDRARELAAEELELTLAQGTDRSIGIALRGVALTGPRDERIANLERSVEHLERSRARLELARSLTELGSTLRRDRRARDAREPLRRAVELARGCGAAASERRALDELGATGERQRSDETDGVAALTPSELRTARMAASGRSNREIAEDLFVTPRTIEVHLTRTYRKLNIRSRRELADALGED